MLKSKKNIIIILFFIIIEIIILVNPSLLIYSVKEGMDLFINKLFISMFPFFVLNEILLEYNLAYYISSLKNNLISKIFSISNHSTSIIILSLLSGHPSNAKYIKDFLDKKLISEKEATKLLIITFFPSPVFVITIVGYLMFNSLLIGFIILLIIYFYNFLLAIFIKNKIKICKYNVSLKIKYNNNFSTILKKSIINSFNTLLIILGNIIIFILLLNIINEYINLNPIIDSIFTSFIELTNGIKKISNLDTNFSLKFSLIIFSFLFSGASIHSQVSSILSDYFINYKLVFLYRFISSIIFTLITIVLTMLIF